MSKFVSRPFVWILIAAALLLAIVPRVDVLAQVPSPGQLNYSVATRPGAIPTTLTDVIRQDAYICAADVSAQTQTILIQDRQPTPVPWIAGTFSDTRSWIWSAAGDGYCRPMVGGISWSASTSGATAYLKIKCSSGPCALVSSK